MKDVIEQCLDRETERGIERQTERERERYSATVANTNRRAAYIL